jgi:hypothetical protein
LGGVASVAAGGKFANGAVTGAFGYLFNAVATCERQLGGCFPGGPGGGGGGGVGPINADAAASITAAATVGVAASGGVFDDLLATMASIGSAVTNFASTLVHGNSLLSTRPTWVYELQDATGNTLKYGITSEIDPTDRYWTSFYVLTGSNMNILGQYPDRATARFVEIRLCAGYIAANGRLPPLSLTC